MEYLIYRKIIVITVTNKHNKIVMYDSISEFFNKISESNEIAFNGDSDFKKTDNDNTNNT